MCCLFGLLDYSHSLTSRQKSRMLSALATASEARGTDATGIAFNSNGRLRVYKRPVAGHRMKFRVPEDAAFIKFNCYYDYILLIYSKTFKV